MLKISLKKFREDYPQYSNIKDEWFEWFIGFSEADGSFVVTRREDCEFVITQYEPNIRVLEEIKEVFGFGSVIIQSKRLDRSVHKGKGAKEAVYRWVVRDVRSLRVVISLFNNGNLVLPIKKARFKDFCSKFVVKLDRVLKNKPGKFGPKGTNPVKEIIINIPEGDTFFSKEDGWLSGFTDGDGSFSLSFLSNSIDFRLRYCIGAPIHSSNYMESTKYVIDHIKREFFNDVGSCRLESKKGGKDYYEYRINGVKNCSLVYDYFDSFSPKCSSKLAMYLLHKIMREKIVAKDHLNIKKRNEMIVLWKTISKH